MWLLIPAKSATLAKSRLAPVLGEQARALLARLLLARLLTVATRCEAVTQALVISGDVGLRTLAHLFGYPSLPDPLPALNPALEAGRAYALAQGCESLLVLPTDLPYLTVESLARLIAQAPAGPGVLIARDAQGSGTNALLLRPADAIPFSFGVGSAQQHLALARRAGLPVLEYHDPGLAYDLDSPEDWARLVA